MTTLPPAKWTGTTTGTTGTDEPAGLARLARLVSGGWGAARSVRARILTWVIVLTAVGMAGAAGAAYLLESKRIDLRIDRSLYQEIEEFAEFHRTGVDPVTGARFTSVDRLLQVAVSRNVPDEHQTIVAFLPEQTFVPREALPLHSDPGFRSEATASDVPVYGSYRSPDGSIRFATMPVAQGDRRGTFVVAYYTAHEHAEFTDVIRTYSVVAVIALIFVALAAWLSAGRLLRPIRDVRRTALLISDTDLTRRIDVNGHDDVSELARTFNAMLDRLEDAFAAQREFLDDAGHELRTPITIVRGHLELLDGSDPHDVAETRDLLVGELDRMSRLVEDLVLLARSERPDFLRPAAVEVGMLTDLVFDKARALGSRQWRIDRHAQVTITADPQRLTQALVQLAQNAVKFTGPDDVVAIGSSEDAEYVRLWVRDSGLGVPAVDAERIFERFQRRGGTRSAEGSGLGLAIVRAIAEAHGGRAWVESPPGTGATFLLEIPRTAVRYRGWSKGYRGAGNGERA
ncbi:sensor histidine kinase [Kribbella catacumbae]|uniref:sensor histidine kinase n=1 Tax=Kribbella catacumbae TaxID=460086 RepID=UPI0003729B91|nr:HAMP domain-containing sensor histidine kinase [Kribbella catacumbae]